MNMKGTLDFACSNFTYYYLHQRQCLFEQIFDVLDKNGRWAYNITSYLCGIELEGRTYNQFSFIFFENLDSILKKRGYPRGMGSPIKEVPTLEEELHLLKTVGFSSVDVETFFLPLPPSKAYYFTLEGFYRYGLTPSFSDTLCKIALSDRMKILKNAVESAKEEMDASKERPAVLNVVATK